MMRDDFWSVISMAAAPVPVILANENGPKPARPFASLFVRAGIPLPVQRGPLDDEGIQPIEGTRPVTLELQIFGEEASEIASRIFLALSKDSVQSEAEALNLAILDEVTIQDVTVLVDATTYESRSVMTIAAAYTATIYDDVGLIERVIGEIGTTPGNFPPTPFDIGV